MRAACNLLDFPELPTTPVQASAIAGDFNVDFPDINIAYSPAQQKLLGGLGSNAYTSLLALTNPPNTPAINGQRTTRIGPTAFEGQRVYRLKHPNPIQNGNPLAANFVPIDLAALAGINIMGNDDWTTRLKGAPRNAGVTWAAILGNATYTDLILAAFDTQVINNTAYYLASAFDNCFVRGAAMTANRVLDLFSELGSWPLSAGWPAAAGRLNGLASTFLLLPGATLKFKYSASAKTVTYNISPTLADAEDAAVFYDKYISDHLPIMVEIQL